MGKSSATAEAMITVRKSVRVPELIDAVSGQTAAKRLKAKLTMTEPRTTGSFLAGGMMIARNMPYSATERARLLRHLGLPEKMTAKALLGVINDCMTPEEFYDYFRK